MMERAMGAVFLATLPSRLRAAQRPVRFALTAVVVRENLNFFDRWAAWFKDKVGLSVEFLQRRSYREVMDLLEAGESDFAWICGFPFVRSQRTVDLLLTPKYRGEPLYRSYIIAHKNAPFHSLLDLEGRIFAYSDPDSNSGFMVPRVMLTERERRPDSFFRMTFFTYSHAETIEAVAEQVAEGGAVDSYVWEHLRQIRPQLVANTKVVQESQTFGFPPIVSRRGLDGGLRERMASALLAMPDNSEGRALLGELMLDGFIKASPDLYNGIRTAFARLSQAEMDGGR
jgi:phosphonate transport system substrate-binding protein